MIRLYHGTDVSVSVLPSLRKSRYGYPCLFLTDSYHLASLYASVTFGRVYFVDIVLPPDLVFYDFTGHTIIQLPSNKSVVDYADFHFLNQTAFCLQSVFDSPNRHFPPIQSDIFCFFSSHFQSLIFREFNTIS
jgi:hypothetical protein